MSDPRLMSVNEKLNRYFTLIKTENPNMSERDILERAATMAMKEQKEFEAKAQLDVNDVSIIDRFGDGTRIKTAADGTPIVRVDHAWQQSKGSKISSDGFYKKGWDTVTLPKSVDTDTPEGNKKAGEFVEHLRAAKRRGDKIRNAAAQQEWENRPIQVTVDKKEDS